MKYTTTWINHLQAKTTADLARTQFGWTDDDHGSFILGKEEICGNEIKSNPASVQTAGLMSYFEPKGTFEKWKELINFYDRDGFELHQFIVCTSFGSPLMSFLPIHCAGLHLYGGTGVGKTTVLMDILGDLNNAGKRVLFVSGEMNQIDMVGYVKRFPKFGDLPILFMGDYADEDPLEVLELAFEDGYDVVMIDSLAEVAVAIQDYHGGTYKGATSKILTLLEEQNMGENKRAINTASLLIQQVTKSGSFAGSNRIKHMTTAMGHLKFDGDGGRYLAFSKNRRGGNMNKFYFNLSTKNSVNWMYEAPANAE